MKRRLVRSTGILADQPEAITIHVSIDNPGEERLDALTNQIMDLLDDGVLGPVLTWEPYRVEDDDDLRAALAALAEKWQRERVAHTPHGAANELTALLGGDTSALDKRLAEERERIAAAIGDGPYGHRIMRGEYPPVWYIDAEDAARIARAGGTPT